MSCPPLIAHVIFHFGVGGMENGLVNLINHISADRYRHAIICLKGYSEFHKRLNRDDVEIIALNKREGNDFGIYGKLYRIFKQLDPDIVHTRNLAAMEAQPIAAAAGIKARVHGEHGRDIFDLDGKNWKYNLLRQSIRPLVHRYIAVSKDLEKWLINTIGVSSAKMHQIYNGVEYSRFHPGNTTPAGIFPPGFLDGNPFIIGSVGRMVEVKNFPLLIQAFLKLRNELSVAGRPLRLIIAGDGVAKAECEAMLRSAGLEQYAWLPGERNDIPRLMQVMHLFVLPSLSEGISNTILEAMASGLPVVATRVGGNIELVLEGETGCLVPSGDPVAMAGAIREYYQDDVMSRRYGQRAREIIEQRFSMHAMTNSYLAVYDKVLGLNTEQPTTIN
ncbi:TIGR03088 family PEP-CTERM/XrtA system glycosyltransferase [Nitrosomonas europaea]|uniref:TIGR03088 family PEP-CTERM/XrtA system glycosyltransferase n=1 Tax=Nitrosomonas europaea TaxID=915 RepID=UPI0023F489DE|nr:TIGR03088 family PEP-CTERM/XrtA system glycosyltransferase [Nitrosomonas europaea]